MNMKTNMQILKKLEKVESIINKVDSNELIFINEYLSCLINRYNNKKEYRVKPEKDEVYLDIVLKTKEDNNEETKFLHDNDTKIEKPKNLKNTKLKQEQMTYIKKYGEVSPEAWMHIIPPKFKKKCLIHYMLSHRLDEQTIKTKVKDFENEPFLIRTYKGDNSKIHWSYFSYREKPTQGTHNLKKNKNSNGFNSELWNKDPWFEHLLNLQIFFTKSQNNDTPVSVFDSEYITYCLLIKYHNIRDDEKNTFHYQIYIGKQNGVNRWAKGGHMTQIISAIEKIEETNKFKKKVSLCEYAAAYFGAHNCALFVIDKSTKEHELSNSFQGPSFLEENPINMVNSYLSLSPISGNSKNKENFNDPNKTYHSQRHSNHEYIG